MSKDHEKRDSEGPAEQFAIRRHVEIAVNPRRAPRDLGDTNTPSESIARSNKWLTIVCDRFAVSPEVFDDMLIVRASKKSVDLVSRDHEPPQAPVPDSSGMKFIHTTMAYPKVTTQAAMLLGRHARRNIIEVSRTQADDYLHRRDFEIADHQTEQCTGTGYVVIQHDGNVLGIGFYRPASERETNGQNEPFEKGLVRSMYPKSVALPDDVSAFDGPDRQPA